MQLTRSSGPAFPQRACTQPPIEPNSSAVHRPLPGRGAGCSVAGSDSAVAVNNCLKSASTQSSWTQSTSKSLAAARSALTTAGNRSTDCGSKPGASAALKVNARNCQPGSGSGSVEQPMQAAIAIQHDGLRLRNMGVFLVHGLPRGADPVLIQGVNAVRARLTGGSNFPGCLAEVAQK